MRRRLLAAACLSLVLVPSAAAQAADEIVVLRDLDSSVASETAQRERALGFDADQSYNRAIKGFAADLTAEQVADLRGDPEVASVVPNLPVRARAAVPATPARVMPGVRRITGSTGSTARESAMSPVAVIDSGVDLGHPDLNVTEGTNCVPGEEGDPPDDAAGHGTHVAGIIGALNNGFGVTGVAPGTEIYAVKVLDDEGAGDTSTILCGIEWVLDNRVATGIDVVNLSLGGGGFAESTCTNEVDGMHEALCNLAGAGIVPVVAAGNEASDVNAVPENGPDFVCPGPATVCPDAPGSFDEVLSVTAMNDTDGLSGGAGGQCFSDLDDHPADFSNFATSSAEAAHMVTAPGDCVVSTFPGGYAELDGTSMAAPHAAALVALCKGEGSVAGPCASMSTAQVIARMRAPGPQSPYFGVTGRLYGPLALLDDLTDPSGAVVEPGSAPARPQTPASQPAQPQPSQPAPTTSPAPPAPTATPVAPVGPPATTTSIRPRIALTGRTRLGRLRSTGLSVRVQCPSACTGLLRIRISRAVQKKLKLRSPTLATVRVRRAGTIRLKLTKAARSALKRQRSLTATVVADLKVGTRTVRATAKLSAKR